MELTYSSLKSFLECPRKFFYSYIKKIKPKITPRPLSVGAAFHEAVEKIDSTYELEPGIEAIEKYFNACQEKIINIGAEETIDDDLNENESRKKESVDLATFYFQSDHHKKPYKVIRYEYEGRVFFRNPFTRKKIRKFPFRFKVDGVCEDIHGNWWILERKTAARIDDAYIKSLSLDLQSILYLAALSVDCGKNFAGVIYEVSTKNLPSPPKLLKNGTLSVAKNQNTTVKLFKEAIKKNELNESDYSEFIEWLEKNEKKYFYREWLVPFSDTFSTQEMFFQIKKRIDRCLKQKEFYQNLTSCHGFGFCQFWDICNSIDKEFAIEKGYVLKEKMHEEYKREETPF